MLIPEIFPSRNLHFKRNIGKQFTHTQAHIVRSALLCDWSVTECCVRSCKNVVKLLFIRVIYVPFCVCDFVLLLSFLSAQCNAFFFCLKGKFKVVIMLHRTICVYYYINVFIVFINRPFMYIVRCTTLFQILCFVCKTLASWENKVQFNVVYV